MSVSIDENGSYTGDTLINVIQWVARELSEEEYRYAMLKSDPQPDSPGWQRKMTICAWQLDMLQNLAAELGARGGQSKSF